ncbi:MAG: hypothetical protein Q7S56_02795 [Nanoarchaeota archaeon]|nr:hypothetical protein [Nanoarchaeota archaeon]
MGTRLNIPELREYLIDLYERFLQGEDIRATARKVFNDYRGSSRFISEDMQKAIGFLEDIGWDIPPQVSRIDKPLKEIALEMLKALKEEEENPPKEWFRDVYEKDLREKELL